ncbi:hypothetical protein C7U57_29690 [Pseudomonas sp. R9.37]|nr:hypothetical protein C7U57_29690 [Pseudomonas sp. R9.37]
MWERACSRMRWVSQYRCRLFYRIREQARSHLESVSPINCCSELFIVNPPVVQLFSPNCSLLLMPEQPIGSMSLQINHLPVLARNSLWALVERIARFIPIIKKGVSCH